jgi:hypothetical protein
MANIRMITDLNVSTDIVASPVQVNKYGGKAIYLNGPNKSRLMFQVPALKAIVGVKESTTIPGAWSMPLSLDNEAVLKVFQQLDDLTVDLLVKNCDQLFGKKVTKESILNSESYHPLVKASNDPKYPPLLQIKPLINKETKQFETKAYTPKREPVPLSNMEKGQRVTCIIEIAQIWRSAMGYGLSVRLQQVMFSPTTRLPDCAFLPSADEPVVVSDEAEDEEGEEDDEEMSD